MSPYYLAITYFLLSGTPVPAEPVLARHDDGTQVVELLDCLEQRDHIIRKFYEDNAASKNSVFYDIGVECIRK